MELCYQRRRRPFRFGDLLGRASQMLPIGGRPDGQLEREGVSLGLTQYRMSSRETLGRRPKVDYIYLAVLLMSFPGYPLVAAFSTIAGLPNTPLSMALRAANFGLALVLILAGIASRRNGEGSLQ